MTPTGWSSGDSGDTGGWAEGSFFRFDAEPPGAGDYVLDVVLEKAKFLWDMA